MNDPRHVDFATLVRATPERVYESLTTGRGLDAWFTTGAEVQAEEGGEVIFRWEDWGLERYTGEFRGSVLEAVQPTRFVFRWPADSGGYQTTVEITIEAHESGSVVRLIEHGFKDGSVGTQDLLNRSSGWAQALTLLKFYLEHGVRY